MALFCLWRFTSILGTLVVLKQTSVKDRLESKKYIGVWRWESETMTRMMSRFPKTVTRNISRNSPKRMGWRSGSSENPKRKNCITPVWFSNSIICLESEGKNTGDWSQKQMYKLMEFCSITYPTLYFFHLCILLFTKLFYCTKKLLDYRIK